MKDSKTQNELAFGLTPEDLALLYNFPSLGKTFEAKEDLEKMKQKLQNTHSDYERVIRQGSKEDAEKATKAANSIKTTLDLIDEIENILLEQSKK
ncbi:MAG: hypothetical protein MUC29_04615 [Pyrinomonadaceae bacterium]|jgi:molecular chaperone GrpE (heat shock protein)|nr:hypothetical protein [Pyrinomonadaceae bacterium]